MSAGTAARPAPLQAWFVDWLASTSDDMIYKKAASAQVMFIRDSLAAALVSSREEWQGAVTVLSEHHSKSVRLPVYHIDLPGLELVIRDNFYNWKVSVRSDAPIHNVGGWGLFDEIDETRIRGVYCEGFPDEWVFGPYAKDQKRFTVEMYSKYDLYAFCLLARGKVPRRA